MNAFPEDETNIIVDKVIVHFYFNGNILPTEFTSLVKFREYQTGILNPFLNLTNINLQNLKERLTLLSDMLTVTINNHSGLFSGPCDKYLKEAWGIENWRDCKDEFTSGIINLMYYNMIDNMTDQMNGYELIILYRYLININENDPIGNAYITNENPPEEVKPSLNEIL